MPDDRYLRAGGIEVWRVEPAAATRVAGLLSAEERQRIARFGGEEDRARHTAGRALARWRLGALLGVPPAEVPLGRAPSGKPVLALESPVRFNVAHSGQLVLCAVAWGRDVGIDVERLRAAPAARIARRFFHPDESAALAAAPEEQAAFFRCWTRKEALLKAWGTGLIGGLGSFCVSLAPDAVVQVQRAGEPWCVSDVALPLPGYAAALAAQGSTLAYELGAWTP